MILSRPRSSSARRGRCRTDSSSSLVLLLGGDDLDVRSRAPSPRASKVASWSRDCVAVAISTQVRRAPSPARPGLTSIFSARSARDAPWRMTDRSAPLPSRDATRRRWSVLSAPHTHGALPDGSYPAFGDFAALTLPMRLRRRRDRRDRRHVRDRCSVHRRPGSYCRRLGPHGSRRVRRPDRHPGSRRPDPDGCGPAAPRRGPPWPPSPRTTATEAAALPLALAGTARTTATTVISSRTSHRMRTRNITRRRGVRHPACGRTGCCPGAGPERAGAESHLKRALPPSAPAHAYLSVRARSRSVAAVVLVLNRLAIVRTALVVTTIVDYGDRSADS